MIALTQFPPASDLEAFRATLPNRLRVSIATPIDDGHKFCYWQSLLSLATARTGHDFRLALHPGDSLITRCRDNMNHAFYFGTGDDYLFFIDSDIDFRVEDVIRLVSHRLPIAAGLYAIKEENLRWCLNTLKDEAPHPETGLQKVATAGTGFLCYHRSVIGRMIAAAPQWPHWKVRYIDDAHRDDRYHIFADEVIDDPEWFTHTPRRMSEDWSFCYFARRLGYDVWMDTKVITHHRGEINYPLNTRRQTEDEARAANRS
jgi:hypothetical protein